MKRVGLAQLRKASGFTQEGLAEALHVDRTTIHRWESGQSVPLPYLWPKLATLLGVTKQSLLRLLRADDSASVPVLSSVDETQAGDAGSAVDRGSVVADEVRHSQEAWLRVRQARGWKVGRRAVELYPASARAECGPVLAGPGWLLDKPVSLDEVRLVRSFDTTPTPTLTGSHSHVLPLNNSGVLYSGYSRAVRDIVRPRLLENRVSYRLLNVNVNNGLTLTFGTTTFFETFDVKESLAHEFRGAWLAAGGVLPKWANLPLRRSIVDPFDPRELLMSPGISTLTIRRDKWGEHRFLLHQRDGNAVADGGGLCSVMPAGEFQPSSVAQADIGNDFSLWRNIMREFSEELLGNSEHDGGGVHLIDYAADEPFRSFEHARREGRFRLWHYGLVMDALTLGASQRTVAVIEDEVFDGLFAGLVSANDEGDLVTLGSGVGVPFTADAIERLRSRMSASSWALLQMAWRDRTMLLGD
ncbi:helix-turn-helix transcriptional regulator [Actinokineospora sp.]|uniref:helix-turn-helix transcriptional regulator n=1 Tax=Actinokineospora sp. TaxID=1872133 RepID=UPI00403771FD